MFRSAVIQDFWDPKFRVPICHGPVFGVNKKSNGLLNLTRGRQEVVSQPGVLFPPCLYPSARGIDADPFDVTHTDPSLRVR